MEFTESMAKISEDLGSALDYSKEDEEYRFQINLDSGRKQIVHAYPFEEKGKMMIRFYTPVGSKESYSEKQLITTLQLNASLLYGAFALYNGTLIIVATWPQESSESGEVIAMIKYLASMGDTYEEMTLGLDKH
jgi:hypothetical protein